LFPSTGPGACAESNQGEIFYLLAPDSAGQFGNAFPASSIRQLTRGTIAHEFQHMINAGNRYVNNIPSFESSWLDEALAHTAEDNVGRAELGYGDLDPFTLDAMIAMDTAMFSAFFAENLARAQHYVLHPELTGPIVSSERAEESLASRGAEWAFLRYTIDWYSNNNPRAFTRALVAGPDTGTANLMNRTGASLDTLLARWLVTMYTDHQSIADLPAQYNYKTYALRDIISDLCAGSSCTQPTYLPVAPIGTAIAPITIGVPSSSADYFMDDVTTFGAARTIRVDSLGGATTVNPYGRFYVIRVH
jgi:hypothetical protein